MTTTDFQQSSEAQALACSISEFSAEERQRHQQVADELRAVRQSVRELPDGYSFQYPSDTHTFMTIAEFVSREHLCCPFFRFTLEVEPGAGSVWLRVTGDSHVKEFLQAETNLV